MNNIDNSSTKSSVMTKVMMTCFALLLMMPVLTSSLIAISSNSLAQTTPAGGIGQLKEKDANKTALSKVMCNVFSIVTGAAGKTFAAFAIVSVGIGFFTGKVSWGLMVGVAAGIAAIFGAPTIVSAISGGKAVDCSADVFGP